MDTATGACSPTAYVQQSGFRQFGMGFVPQQDGGEPLYLSNTNAGQSLNGSLAWLTPPTFSLTYVGPFSPPAPRCKVAGTGGGKAFLFCMNYSTGSTLAQIDPTTATQIGEADMLQAGGSFNTFGPDVFAFSFWGGKFYLFTAVVQGAQEVSIITEFDPVKKTETVLESLPELIVGAGVATCLPL